MNRLRRGIDARDWTRGAPGARVTLLEYGDYECPACGRAFAELEIVTRQAGERLRFAFRHFPLSQIHPHATLAAEAAEAAGAQGRFWEMHGALYRNQRDLSVQALVDHAAALDLDIARFQQDLREHRHLPKVRADFLGGVRSGVTGTPTFFIDDVRWDGPATADALLVGLDGAPG